MKFLKAKLEFEFLPSFSNHLKNDYGLLLCMILIDP